MYNSHIADTLNRINNCIKIKKRIAIINKTKTILAISTILKNLGYIKHIEVLTTTILINISQNHTKIKKLTLISKPSKRKYIKPKHIHLEVNKTIIISTHMGILDDKTAIAHNVGGELLFSISK